MQQIIGLTLISWLVSFSLIIILPYDLYDTLRPENEQQRQNIRITWTTMYWVSFVLTWLCLPLTLDYESSGDFTFKNKIIKSLKINGITYGIGLVLSIVFTIVLLVKHSFNMTKLLAFMVVLSNGFGLVLITILLGYSMVSIPKKFYRESDHQMQLNSKYFMINQTKYILEEQILELEDKVLQVLAYQAKYRNNEEFSANLDIIVKQFTPEIIFQAQKQRRNDLQLEDMSLDLLVTLNEQSIDIQLNTTRNQYKLQQLIDQALFIEDIINSENKITSSVRLQRRGCFGGLIDRIQYLYYKTFWKYIMYFLCGLFTSLAVILVLAQFSIFLQFDMNLFWHVVKKDEQFFPIQITMFIPIIYVFYCIQYSLLSIRLYRYGFYQNHTDGPSLIFSATFISRIAFPLAFNFMWMFNFTDSDVTSVIGDFSFNDYLSWFKYMIPGLLSLMILINIFNVYDKLMNALGFQRFMFSENENEENIKQGIDIVELARKEKANSIVHVEGKLPHIGHNWKFIKVSRQQRRQSKSLSIKYAKYEMDDYVKDLDPNVDILINNIMNEMNQEMEFQYAVHQRAKSKIKESQYRRGTVSTVAEIRERTHNTIIQEQQTKLNIGQIKFRNDTITQEIPQPVQRIVRDRYQEIKQQRSMTNSILHKKFRVNKPRLHYSQMIRRDS
ncbi:hypothetical protein pb186bvf_013901 [Paramecium bursaria]